MAQARYKFYYRKWIVSATDTQIWENLSTEKYLWLQRAKKNFFSSAFLKWNTTIKRKWSNIFCHRNLKISEYCFHSERLKKKKPSKYLRIHKIFRMKILPTPYKTISTYYFYIFRTKNKTTLNLEQYFWFSIICTWRICFFFFLIIWQIINRSHVYVSAHKKLIQFSCYFLGIRIELCQFQIVWMCILAIKQ